MITKLKEAVSQLEHHCGGRCNAEYNPCADHESAQDLRTVIAQMESSEPTEEAAHAIGAKGAAPTESERMLFEAWMKGHCWAVIGVWNGITYIHPHESKGYTVPSAMNTRQLWAVWRDRAALAAPVQPKPEPDPDFETWWAREGGAMQPLQSHDMEEHAKRVAAISWANDAYCAENKS